LVLSTSSISRSRPSSWAPGEHLLGGIDVVKLGYRVTEHVASPNALHVVFAKGS
jgi:hypothetical protein